MKILITGKFMPTGARPIGGLQSWIKTVKAELERIGHSVTLWEPHEIDSSKDGMSFDLGIFSNIKYTRQALLHCHKSILISHGIIDDEKPSDSCDVTLYVSEGVRDHWSGEAGCPPGEILRQPIDTDYWKPDRLTKNKLTRFSYRNGNVHDRVVADQMDLDFYHLKDLDQDDAKDVINSSVCVFASGRACLESMSCGVPTVIYDHRDAYQPPLLDTDINNQMKNSYSGRGGFNPSSAKVYAVTKQVIENGSMRDWVINNHRVDKIVKELLDA